MEGQDLARAQKKARNEGRTIVFIDESGLSERCPVTKTWAKRGQTPVIQQSFSWSQMSAIAEWKRKTWPALKKKRAARAERSCS